MGGFNARRSCWPVFVSMRPVSFPRGGLAKGRPMSDKDKAKSSHGSMYRAFADLITQETGIELIGEYRIGQRRYRWDYAAPELQVVIEIQGGTWSRGIHGRGQGINRDMDKLNYAATHGWRTLQYTPQQFGEIDNVVKDLQGIRQEKGGCNVSN